MQNRLEHLDNHPTASSGWIYTFGKTYVSVAGRPKLPNALAGNDDLSPSAGWCNACFRSLRWDYDVPP